MDRGRRSAGYALEKIKTGTPRDAVTFRREVAFPRPLTLRSGGTKGGVESFFTAGHCSPLQNVEEIVN